MAKIFKIATRIGYIVASLIIIFALLVSLGRLLTPYLNDHLPDFESWATDILQVPIKIKRVKISWNAYEPEMEFENVTVLNKQNLKPQFTVREIKINLNIVRSLLTFAPITENIKIRGAHLTLIKTPKGLPLIEELKGLSVMDNSTESSSHLSDVLAWIFTQPSLVLQEIDITYKENLDIKYIALNELMLKNNTHHEIFGDGVLKQAVPLHVQIHLDWRGDFTDLDHVSADMYFYIEGISLPQWLSNYSWKNLTVAEGVGSAKIWLTWSDNHFQQIQSQFQFYDVMLDASLTKQSIEMPRLSGHFGWKKNGNQDIYAGNDILIDLPNHLWPITTFQAIVSPDSTNTKKLKSLQIGYLDLVDLRGFLDASGLIPEDVRIKLASIQPKGEVRNLTLLTPTGSIDDVNLTAIRFDFLNLGFHSWQTYPSMTGAKGQFAWNGKLGTLVLNNMNTTLEYQKLFNRPLSFSRFITSLQWQKLDDGSWMILLKNLQALNQHMNLQARMSLAFPINQSPIINLSGSFNLKEADKILDYLPMKTFQPDLVKWLSKAFLKGQIESGKAIIQGRLSDFPFEHGNGTFLISGIIKDLDLQFSSKWPHLTDINGELIFSGSSMTAELNSAKILGNDLSLVRASIPSLGSKVPQILNIQGFVQSDLAQGLKVINQSPLQNTLGKDLSELNPKGLMHLKLELAIPLKQPDKIAVSGDLSLTDASLNSSVGNLLFDQLTGNLHFTEKTIEGKNIIGRVFTAPAQMDITTIQDSNKPAFVKVNVRGTLDVNALQKELKFPLEKYAKGSTTYQAELHLASHNQPQPTQIIITSDLKGIELDLPNALEKKTDDVRDFKSEIDFSPEKPVFIKMHYSKLLSAIMSFDKKPQGIKFSRGELRLGGGDAILPTQQGLFITAQFDKLNWAMLQPYLNFESKKTTEVQASALKLGSGILRGININANVFNLWGQQLTDPHLAVSKDKSWWLININSGEVAGQVSLSENFKELKAKFQRFHMKPSEEPVSQVINPASIPVLNLSANDVQYGDFKLGAVNINTTPTSNGMMIRELNTTDGITRIFATGSWEGVNKPVTHLQGRLDTTNINQTLAQWGNRTSSLVGSDASVQFDLTWPDSPYNPSFKNITGNLSVNLGHGRIVNLSESTEAKIGLGRMLTLFSLQSIPRRLSLDFSDLFQNGYSFDSVKGNFKLRNGSAYTNDLHFDGPVASINLTGRIGFQAKDFALNLGVTTYMSSSILPAAIGWLGGPIAGVATWVVSTAMSQATSKVATYQYVITGPWSNPQWRQTGASKVSTPLPRR